MHRTKDPWLMDMRPFVFAAAAMTPALFWGRHVLLIGFLGFAAGEWYYNRDD
jgi:hypothetical protein